MPARRTAVWGASGLPQASHQSAGDHQVEGGPRGQQTVSEFQVLEAHKVPHAGAKQTSKKDSPLGILERPGAAVLALMANALRLGDPNPSSQLGHAAVPDTGGGGSRNGSIEGIQTSGFMH